MLMLLIIFMLTLYRAILLHIKLLLLCLQVQIVNFIEKLKTKNKKNYLMEERS